VKNKTRWLIWYQPAGILIKINPGPVGIEKHLKRRYKTRRCGGEKQSGMKNQFQNIRTIILCGKRELNPQAFWLTVITIQQ